VSLFASRESVVKFAKKCSSAAEAVEVDSASVTAAEDEDEEPRPQSDSDIEPASEEEEGPPVTDLGSGLQLLPTMEEQNQDSIVSDGIPVVESGDDDDGDNSVGAPSRIWASEDDLLTGQLTSGNDTTGDGSDEQETKRAPKDSSDVLSSLYPMVNELPAEFPSIRKGPAQPVYNHVPNKKLNVLLTTCVVVACVFGIGIGIGHFIGWSEKLELQEQYAEERETKMDELTDSLVTCITGEEGNGGDDQDLEERVIRQLSEENNELKLALAQLKAEAESSSPVPSQSTIPVMLRQRINELMVANADLEKEVARLRYSHSAMLEAEETKSDLHNSRTDLQKARETLNDVATENQQLKIVIGKTRYGGGPPPPQPDDLEEEQTSSSEKAEPKANTGQEEDSKCPKTVVDYFTTELKKMKESAGDMIKEFVPEDKLESWGQKFEAKIDSALRAIPSKVAPTLRGANKMVNKLEDSLNKGLAKASQFLETQLGEDPLEWKDKQLNKLEKGLSMLLDEWHFDETVGKPTDEKKCKKDKNNNGECSAETECKASSVEEKTTKDHPKMEKNKKYKKDQKKWDKKKDKHRDKASSEEYKFQDNQNNATATDEGGEKKWVFARAKNREEFRSQDRKSDWVFDRASNRKKFHDLTNAEWYEKKLKSKDCDGDDCEDLTEMNPGSQNHGQKKSKHHHKFDKNGEFHKKQDHHKKHDNYNKQKPKDEEGGDDDEVNVKFRKHQKTKENRRRYRRYTDAEADILRHEIRKEFHKSHKNHFDLNFEADFKFESKPSHHHKENQKKDHKRDPNQHNPKKFGREQHIRFN